MHLRAIETPSSASLFVQEGLAAAGTGEDAHATLRLSAPALRRQVEALRQLVLEATDVGVLRRQLYRPVLRHHGVNRFFRLRHRAENGVAAARLRLRDLEQGLLHLD